jgi:hypothetical protein
MRRKRKVYVPELDRFVEYLVDVHEPRQVGEYAKYVVTVPEFEASGSTNQNDKAQGVALRLIKGATS